MAKILGINLSEVKVGVKTPIEKGFLKVDFGLEGDAHGGDWHRQVSLLGIESVDKIREKAIIELTPGIFAENITTEGIILYELPVGTRLSIGQSILEITQIGKECHKGCTVMKTAGDCVMPREGIFAKVIKDGWIKPGDEIKII